MPLFTAYLNSVADAMVDDAGTLYLHTVAPTDADHTNGRTSAGGTAFENGSGHGRRQLDHCRQRRY